MAKTSDGAGTGLDERLHVDRNTGAFPRCILLAASASATSCPLQSPRPACTAGVQRVRIPVRIAADCSSQASTCVIQMAACLRFTRRVWRSFVENKGHDQQCFPNLRIIDAKPGVLQASLKIEPYNLNRVGTVHGGLIMSLTDTLGSLAVATKGQYMTGVSVDIGTSFVKPAGRVGEELTAKAVVTGIGRSLAYTRIDFYNAQGQLAAYGHHTKYVGKSAGHQSDVKFSEDGERVIEGEDVD